MEIFVVKDTLNLSDVPWKEIADALRDGKIIVHASDTCYGLTADALNPAAVERVLQIKRSPSQKSMSVFLGNTDQIKSYAIISPEAELFIAQHLPGPFTVILKKKESFTYQPFTDSIGIRVPVNKFMNELADRFEKPLVTTSANISGNPPLYSGAEVINEWREEYLSPDMLLDFGEIEKNPPSRIISFAEGEEKWLR